MTSSNSFRRFAFAYGIAFAALYVAALKLDISPFTQFDGAAVTAFDGRSRSHSRTL